ncbi:MAG: diacylglycerol/lipid kinase family protein [Acutalibacteraceae bacterium]
MSKHQLPRKKIMLIVNPRAGKMQSKFALPDIVDMWYKNGYETVVYYTAADIGADELVKTHAPDYDIVACCGGDGTVNSVIDGLMQMKNRPPLGFIPAGTTNDLASSLGLPKKLRRSAHLISHEEPLTFDIGSFNNDIYFAYIASFGAFTEVSYNTSQSVKNILGHSAYIFAAMRAMPKIKAHHIRIESKELTEEDNYIFGAVTNSTSIAGTFKYEKDYVEFNDGKFEVLLIKDPKNFGTAVKVGLSMMNKSYKNRYITRFHTSEIKIISDEPLDWALDGEHQLGNTVTVIKNNPQAIRIIRKK